MLNFEIGPTLTGLKVEKIFSCLALGLDSIQISKTTKIETKSSS